MSLPKTEVIKDVLKFANRWDLDSLVLVNREFAKLIRIYFSAEPYRLFRKLIIRLFNQSMKNRLAKFPCTALYEHQIKEMSFEQVVKIFGNPNIRFASTYIAIDADYINMEQFFEISHILKQLWEGKNLVIDMDPHRSFEKLRFFSALYNDSITTGAGNLSIIDRSYKYTPRSAFSPFMYADTNRCRQITIASGLTSELAATLLEWLHEGTYKELTWVFLWGEANVALQQARIVAKLIEDLEKKFRASENPSPYKFWMMNVFHIRSLPQEIFNETREEILMFKKDVFRSKRYHSGLEENDFYSGSADIEIERALIHDGSYSSTICMESDSACSSPETASEDEMSI